MQSACPILLIPAETQGQGTAAAQDHLHVKLGQLILTEVTWWVVCEVPVELCSVGFL